MKHGFDIVDGGHLSSKPENRVKRLLRRERGSYRDARMDAIRLANVQPSQIFHVVSRDPTDYKKYTTHGTFIYQPRRK